jgi:hypothetical protein
VSLGDPECRMAGGDLDWWSFASSLKYARTLTVRVKEKGESTGRIADGRNMCLMVAVQIYPEKSRTILVCLL